MKRSDDLDTRVAEELAKLAQTPERSAFKAARGRAAFLREAAQMRAGISSRGDARHKDWKNTFQSIFTPRKDRSPMSTALASIFLIISLVFGGGGVGLVAAESSQPDEPLYALKLWGEEARLRLSSTQQAELEWALRLVERRTTELRTMLEDGKSPSEAVLARYQAQLEQALRLAAAASGDEALQAMIRLQASLGELDQTALKVGEGQPVEIQAHIQAMVQKQLAAVEEKLDDPDQLRRQQQDQDQDKDQDRDQDRLRIHTATPGVGISPTGSCGACTPQATGQGGNPWTDGTPTPGSGYGPGPQPTTEPGNGPGPQPTSDPGYGPGPQPTQEPGPAENPTQAGPQPTQAGPQSTQVQFQPTPAGPKGKP
jgi:hypothetical protein